MICPKCRTENPEMRKFCRECGEKLILLCPKCNSENIPGDKFCGECGHNLTLPSEPAPKELSFDEKLDKIQKYLPKGLTKKILSKRDKIEGERKQVTIIFADISGFTNLTEKLVRQLGPQRGAEELTRQLTVADVAMNDGEAEKGFTRRLRPFLGRGRASRRLSMPDHNGSLRKREGRRTSSLRRSST